MFFRNVSLRSSSINSHSMNTCSSVCCTSYPLQQSSTANETAPINAAPITEACSNQNQIRYRETDLAHLKRPLVVSFRKIPPTTNSTTNSSFEQMQRQSSIQGCNIRRQFFHPDELHATKLSTTDTDSEPYCKHCCLHKPSSNHTQTHRSKKTSENELDAVEFSNAKPSNWARNGNSFSTTRSTRHSWFPIKYFTKEARSKHSSTENISTTKAADEHCHEFSRQSQPSSRELVNGHTSNQLHCQYDLYPHLRNIYLSLNSDLNERTLDVQPMMTNNSVTPGKLSPDCYSKTSLNSKLSVQWDIFDEKPNTRPATSESFISDDDRRERRAGKRRKALRRNRSREAFPPTTHHQQKFEAKLKNSHSLPSIFELDNKHS